MYDLTTEVAVRELAAERAAMQTCVDQEGAIIVPSWLMETLAIVAREWPHLFEMALPDRVRLAYGRRAKEVATAHLSSFFEAD